MYLELKNLSKKYGENTVVDNFNINVEKGELISILGPSGCGKTTTLRMIAGFINPTGGAYFSFGRRYNRLSAGNKTCKYSFSKLCFISSFDSI